MMTTIMTNTVRKTVCSFHTGNEDDDGDGDDDGEEKEHLEQDGLLVPHW